MRRVAVCSIALLLALGAPPASAQYSYNMPNPMASYSMALMNNAMLSAPLYQQMDVMNARARRQAVHQARPAPPPSATGLSFAAGNGAQAVSSYVARLSRQDAATGAQVRTALAGKDIPAIFGQIVAPFGLGNHDVADALAAHLIMRTIVASGAALPSAQGVRAVREAVAQSVARDPKMASAAYRAEIGGLAQIDFVLVNAAWRAIDAGKWPADAAARYRENTAAGLAREGVDLKTMRLGADGFVPK